MKDVLLSIKPEYCELIAKKTIEVRKTRPKIETPFKCYIYCTKQKRKMPYDLYSDELYRLPNGEIKYGCSIELSCYSPTEYSKDNFLNGKVIGEFVCNKITTIFYGCEIMYGIDYPNKHAKQLEAASCLSLEELKHYANDADVYGWHISDLKIYDKPKELSDFGVLCPEFLKVSPICEGCRYENTLYNGLEPPEFDCKCDGLKPLTRPPQSWCYVEE